MLCTRPVLCAFGDRKHLSCIVQVTPRCGLAALAGISSSMAYDSQQQNGVKDTTNSGDNAKLHLPNGEVLELPMLVVCLVFPSILKRVLDL